MSKKIDLAPYIDQSLLKANATPADIDEMCKITLRYGFKALFVNPVHVKRIAASLAGSPVHVGSVVGFPLGASNVRVKVYEAETVENDGADEIDMVMNIGAVKAGDYRAVENEIHAVRSALGSSAILKVILECSLLNEVEKATSAQIAADSGADFVKTSTGTAGGATVEDVELLFKTVGRQVGVKAAGGIRDLKTALAMMEAGASRLGTSSGAAIIDQYLGSMHR
jgi:deoxyribose-phosphate aldolase